MGTLSIIIGVIVFLTALFPNLGYMVIMAAVVGLILGICRLVNDRSCSWAVAGVVLNGLAILLALYWTAITSFTQVNILNRVFIEEPVQEQVHVIYHKPILNVKPLEHTNINKHFEEKAE